MKIIKKQIVAVIALLSTFAGLQAAPAPAPTAPSVIQGTWNRGKISEVSLYEIISGRIETKANYVLGADGSFYFAFKPQKEGFYVIGDNDVLSKNNKYTFYFKPGDNLNVFVNDSTYTLVGKNTAENETMAKWQSLIQKVEDRSIYYFTPYAYRGLKGPSNYVDFFPLVEEVSKKVDAFKATTPNKTFNVTFETYKQYDILLLALNVLTSPRTAHPQTADFTPYYKNIDFDKFTSTNFILTLPFGARSLQSFQYNKGSISGANDYTSAAYQAEFFNSIKNAELQGEIVLGGTRRLKDYETYLEYGEKYEKYLVTPDQQNRWRVLGVSLAAASTNLQTYKFAYPDVDGKVVSLADLKGKVVVVDLWATWCGPCKKEIPFFKTLEEEYRGKDVAFIGISTDKESDKQKWKDFIKNEGMGGIQLFAGQGAEILNFYNITGIPRFLVYSKKGVIVSADAPRPSTPELKKMIERELTK